jgi:hypothetical protein
METSDPKIKDAAPIQIQVVKRVNVSTQRGRHISRTSL